MLKYTVACANRYFRVLHAEGLWLEANRNIQVARAGDEMCVSWHLQLTIINSGNNPSWEQLSLADLRLATRSWPGDARRPRPGSCLV